VNSRTRKRVGEYVYQGIQELERRKVVWLASHVLRGVPSASEFSSELPLVYPRRISAPCLAMQSVGLRSREFLCAATMRSCIRITNIKALCAAPAVSQTASERKERFRPTQPILRFRFAGNVTLDLPSGLISKDFYLRNVSFVISDL